MTDSRLQYHRLFDPGKATPPERADGGKGFGDHRETSAYVYTEAVILAVNVALATARPLLVRGAAGSGKSSLAADVAARKQWDLYSEVISSRTEAKDLLWRFDALRRLRDAQAGDLAEDQRRYIRPGVLWHAFDPASAAGFGPTSGARPVTGAGGAVVLLDEIDKAEPDTPNDLLVPLGAGTFTVTDLEPALDVSVQRAQQPLIIITTNEERDLPQAFVRRCVVLHLPPPGPDRLVAIAAAHFGKQGRKLHQRLALYFEEARGRAESAGVAPPSTAEFLDALAASRELRIEDDGPEWQALMRATLTKWLPDAGTP
ncbi:MoxR family ATPase [Dactylosporangium maewongense]|uniref:MoxR family ATPase n=1 Tax=Dactylosporangium maewongense TaxID=634393 RepID=A0ABN2CKZ8_9ACTN